MIAVIAAHIAGFLFCYGFLSRFFRDDLYDLERIAASVVITVVLDAWVLFLTSFLVGGLSSLSLWATAVIFCVLVFFFRHDLRLPRIKEVFETHRVLLGVLLFSGLLFLHLFNTHTLQRQNGDLYSAGSVWGDLPFHLSLIRSFHEGVNAEFGISSAHTLEYPVYPGARLTYPFLLDFHTAGLLHGGIDVRVGILATGVLLALSLVVLLYFFAFRVTESRGASALAIFLFLFGGGLGFLYFFSDWFGSGKSLWDFLLHLPMDYAHTMGNQGRNIHWSNLIPDLFLPQRATQIVFPAFIFVCSLLWMFWKSPDPKLLLVAGVITGLLPFFQGHVFIGINIIVIFLFLFSAAEGFGKKNSLRISFFTWRWFFVPALLLFLPQFLWIASRVGSWGFGRIQWAWMAGHDGWITFWIKNVGLFIPLYIWATIRLEDRRRQWVLAVWTVFLIANFWIFQPWDYDNIKLLALWDLVGCAVVAGLVWRRHWAPGDTWRRVALTAIIILLTASGFLSILREATLQSQLFDVQDQALAQWIREHTKPDAIFLTSDRHNQPVTALAGRRVVMGYPGWLWSHGISYGDREKDVAEMFSGSKRGMGLLEQYRVNYILVGPSERSKLKPNEALFAKKFTVVLDVGEQRVFQVK